MQPPDYTFDTDRLEALASYAILDTPPERGFDDIVQLAAQICETPVALVSLVAGDRQWFKARVGFAPCETDLNSSVCAHSLTELDLLVIPDLTQDERTVANPLVTGEPGIRFYAGAPLHASSGEVLGSLCVIDTEARPAGLAPPQADALRKLAHQVTSQLELRKAIRNRDALAADQRLAETRRNALLQLGDSLRDLTAIPDMTRTAASIVGQALLVSRVGFARLTPGDDHLFIEPDWTAGGTDSIAGRHRIGDYGDFHEELLRGEAVVIGDVCTDPRSRDNAAPLLDLGIRSLVNMPVRERGRTVAVFILHDRQPRDWSPEVLTFLRNVADRLEVGIARLTAEAEQQVLNHELSHRLKNTFAMIQAIAMQTLRAVPDRTPVEAFVRRLHALATAHDILLQQKWVSAQIGDVVKTVVSRMAELQRFAISGPEVELGPRATLSLSLLLHELTTNAVKYGSLSREGGRVTLTWHLDRRPYGEEIQLDWRETGGPPAAQPSQTGFGSKLIHTGLVGTGGVNIRYLPSGLHAEFRAPLAQVQLP